MGTRSLAQVVQRFYALTHERLLKVSEDIAPEQFAWSAGPSLHSVAWQLWHAARWDDFLGAHIQADFGREPATQVWERESLAERWSLSPGSLGRRDAGTGMDDAAAERMRLPAQAEVVGYARRAFEFIEAAIAAIPDDQLLSTAKDDRDGDTNLDNVFFYFEHLNRHLGMIEAIRGLQGLTGSASQ
ncbi:MAG TPA: DinB family protein [Candidatus Limnocylindrales bacterium]|nr:DinB family protein [Candidatus Limnocylindrales bacterium]